MKTRIVFGIVLAVAMMACGDEPSSLEAGDTGSSNNQSGMDAGKDVECRLSSDCQNGELCVDENGRGVCKPVATPDAGSFDTGTCIPQCVANVKACGFDGCGATCGSCSANELCQQGVCNLVVTPDAGSPDSGSPDSGTIEDVGTPDSGLPDSGTPDSGTPDAGQPDVGETDVGNDIGTPDSGVCVPQCTNRVCGFDGCGSTCGTCAAGSLCQSDGTCVVVETPDAGTPDASDDVGTPDSGTPDAGDTDVGTDAGVDAGPMYTVTCVMPDGQACKPRMYYGGFDVSGQVNASFVGENIIIMVPRETLCASWWFPKADFNAQLSDAGVEGQWIGGGAIKVIAPTGEEVKLVEAPRGNPHNYTAPDPLPGCGN